MYRDADLDIDGDTHSTTSCFSGVKESYQFVPYLEPEIRRTSSADDVSRFHRHFELSQRHCGELFTWRYYATILHEGFRHFKPSKSQRSVYTLRSASTVSGYATALESEASSSYYSMKNGILSNLSRCCLQTTAETKQAAKNLVRKVDQMLHLSKSGGTPKRKKKHTDSPRLGNEVSSDSASSSSSVHQSCGAGDNRKRIFRRQKRKL